MKTGIADIPCLKGGRICLKRVEEADAEALAELMKSETVGRTLPLFLLERQCSDAREAVRRINEESGDALFLGIYEDGIFCGLVELYGPGEDGTRISVGSRLLERCWNRGIATQAMDLLVRWLFAETDVRAVSADTLSTNRGAAAVLKKSGFRLLSGKQPADWGYPQPVEVDTWILDRPEDRGDESGPETEEET